MKWARQDWTFMEGGDLRSSIFSAFSDHNHNQNLEISGELYPKDAQGMMKIKE